MASRSSAVSSGDTIRSSVDSESLIKAARPPATWARQRDVKNPAATRTSSATLSAGTRTSPPRSSSGISYAGSTESNSVPNVIRWHSGVLPLRDWPRPGRGRGTTAGVA